MVHPVADFVTRLRNASRVRLVDVELPLSKFSAGLLRLLRDEGFIDGFSIAKTVGKPRLLAQLRYSGKVSIIQGIKLMSTPGKRLYKKSSELRRVKDGAGMGIVSTSQGLMTDSQARSTGLGGEYILEIW